MSTIDDYVEHTRMVKNDRIKLADNSLYCSAKDSKSPSYAKDSLSDITTNSGKLSRCFENLVETLNGRTIEELNNE